MNRLNLRQGNAQQERFFAEEVIKEQSNRVEPFNHIGV